MRPTDTRGKPGQIVLGRGVEAITTWSMPPMGSGSQSVIAGRSAPGALGIIVCVASEYKAYTYVLWSKPCIAGWVSDGLLRVV